MPARLSSKSLLLAGLTLLAVAAIVALSPERTRVLLVNSAILAIGAAVIALPIGGGIAVVLARFTVPGRYAAVGCLAVLLFVPLLANLSGWDAMLGQQGWQTLVFGQMDEPLLFGMRGAILVHGVAAVPWAAFIVGLGLLQVDPAQEEAALTSASPSAVLCEITLPQTLPFILAAGLWIAVGTTAEMTVTNIYLVSTYTEELYNTFALQADPREAAISVLPGVLSLAIVLLAALATFNRLPLTRLRLASRPRWLWPLGKWKWPVACVIWLMVGMLLVVPIGSLIDKAGFEVTATANGRPSHGWSALKFVRELATVPQGFGRDAYWTVVTAALAATLALAGAIFLGWLARLRECFAWLTAMVTTLTLVAPGPLVGIALIWLLRRPLGPEIALNDIALKDIALKDVAFQDGRSETLLIFLCDRSVLLPVLAQCIRALPLATLICWYSFSTLDDDVLAAAALDGAGPWRRLWRIALSQRWRALVAAWLAALAVALGDLAWSQLVLPPGMDTLQRRVFGLVHSGVEEQVASLSLVMIAASAVLAVLILRLMMRESGVRHFPPRRL